jgi:hypothetical protein
MTNRIIISSTHVDSHGDIMTKEALEKAVVGINSNRKMKWTIDHKRELPPLGRVDKAELIQKGEYFLLTGQPFKYTVSNDVDWDNTLKIEKFDDVEFTYAEIDNIPAEEFEISLDHSNFTSFEEFEKLNKEIYELSNDVKLSMHSRKSEIPVPEIVLTISKYGALYLLLKPFIEKIGEKLAEDFYDETKKQLKLFKVYLTKVIKLTRQKALPKKRKLITIIEIPGNPHIELFARSDDAEFVAKAINENNLMLIGAEINRLANFIDIAKIQFVLNDNGRWGFNYLLTTKGEVLGKKKSFKTRDQLYQRITLGK